MRAPTFPDQLVVAPYGGGVQSTAMLVLAVRGYLPIPTFVYANVGDDSERAGTVRYVREVAFDYAWSNGIELHEVGPARGMSLLQTMMDPTAELLREPIPVRGENGAPFKRSCTAEWKVREVGQWLRAHGASAERPALVNVGISVDEFGRANPANADPWEELHYPLLHIEWQGRSGLTRSDCTQVIRDAGLPMPPKSSCWFCPLHRVSEWVDMARDDPATFDKACELEDHLNARRAQLGHEQRVFLSRRGRPLREAFGGDSQMALLPSDWSDDQEELCGGWCGT